MKLMRQITRFLIGGLFVGHGTQKLFGWFGGHGPEGTAGFLESLGMKPGKPAAIAAGTAEAGGGLLFASGYALPLSAAALISVMTTAIRHVHAPKGPWVTEGGWEYNAVLIGAALSVVEDEWNTGWALAAGAAGVGGSFAMSALTQRRTAQDQDQQPEDASFQPADATTVTAHA